MTDLKKGYFHLAITALIFGTFETVSKKIGALPSSQVNFLRFLIGGLTMLPFALMEIRRRKSKFQWKDFIGMAVLGVLFVVISMGLYQAALARNSASMTVFIFTANPVFIAIFAAIVLKERIDLPVLIFIILGLAGLALIIRPGKEGLNPSMLLPIAAAAVFGLFNVFMRQYAKKFGSLTAFTFVVICGTAVNAIVLLIVRTPLFLGVTGDLLPGLLYLGIFASGITYITYYEGMALTSTNTGSIVFFIKPILSTLMAVVVLKEVLSPLFLVGAGLILAGILFMIIIRERSSNSDPAGGTVT